MKAYEAPICNVVEFDNVDVIRTSGEWAWDNSTYSIGETPRVFMSN